MVAGAFLLFWLMKLARDASDSEYSVWWAAGWK
jgi:hypothetical protein